MTNNLECSENSCFEVATHEIELRGSSPFTKKNYLMWVYVCTNHYREEQEANAIVREKIIK